MTTDDVEYGTNNGKIKSADILALGATLVEDPEKKARGEAPQGFRLPSGAILHGVIPPVPFDHNGADNLSFAQSANLAAAKYEAELAKVEGNRRLSREGKDVESIPIHQHAALGAAVAIKQVELEANKADRELADFYAAPVLATGDQVSAMQDAEARQYLRSLSPREMAKLIDTMQGSDDPKIERMLLGIVRSPLPIASNIEQTALALWRDLRERRNPVELGKRQARANLATWARMVTDTATGLIAGKIQIAAQDIAKRDVGLARGLRFGVFNILDADNFRSTLGHFGFTPLAAAEFRRLQKAA